MRPRRYLAIGLCSLLGAALLAGCVSREVREVRRLTIEHMELSTARDGEYPGEYSYGSFTYAVKVTIHDHRIQRIDIVANRDTTHAKSAERVIERVMEEQRNDVDAVAGATTTSKALLKAVEEAIRKAL